MNSELKQQIDSMAEEFCEMFLDAYQCQDWGISAQDFANILTEQFKVTIADWATDLDREDND